MQIPELDMIASLASPAAFAILFFFFLRWFAYTYLPGQQREHKDQIERIITAHQTDADRDRQMYAASIDRLTLTLDRNSAAVSELANACQLRRSSDRPNPLEQLRKEA